MQVAKADAYSLVLAVSQLAAVAATCVWLPVVAVLAVVMSVWSLVAVYQLMLQVAAYRCAVVLVVAVETLCLALLVQPRVVPYLCAVDRQKSVRPATCACLLVQLAEVLLLVPCASVVAVALVQVVTLRLQPDLAWAMQLKAVACTLMLD